MSLSAFGIRIDFIEIIWGCFCFFNFLDKFKRIGNGSCLKVWKKLLVNPSENGLLFLENTLIIFSISSIVIGLFMYSWSSCLKLGTAYKIKNVFISSRFSCIVFSVLLFKLKLVSHYPLNFYSVCSDLLFHFLFYFIKFSLPYFVSLDNDNSCSFIQRTNSWFHWFFGLFLGVQFITFCSVLLFHYAALILAYLVTLLLISSHLGMVLYNFLSKLYLHLIYLNINPVSKHYWVKSFSHSMGVFVSRQREAEIS